MLLQVGVVVIKAVQVDVLEDANVLDVNVPEIEKVRDFVVVNMEQRKGAEDAGLHKGDQEAELWPDDQVVDDEIVGEVPGRKREKSA